MAAPDAPPAPLTPLETVLLAALKRLMADGKEFPMWGALAIESLVPKGSLGAALDALELRGDIVRDEHGVRHLKGHMIVTAEVGQPITAQAPEPPFIQPPTKAQLMARR